MKAIKLLGMLIQSDFKGNTHIVETDKKANKQLYFLVQLKRAKVSECKLVKFCVACFQSVLLYGCQAFHFSLSQYLSIFMEGSRNVPSKLFLVMMSVMRLPFHA